LIIYSPPNEPVLIKDPKHKLMYYKYMFFKNGISPAEFNKTDMRDIKAMLDIDNAMSSKKDRAVYIQNLQNQMGLI